MNQEDISCLISLPEIHSLPYLHPFQFPMLYPVINGGFRNFKKRTDFLYFVQRFSVESRVSIILATNGCSFWFLFHETCVWLADDAQKDRQFLYAVRKAKPDYIRNQVLLVRDTVNAADKTTISEALTSCCENNIKSAMDFKTIVDQKLQAKVAVLFILDQPFK